MFFMDPDDEVCRGDGCRDQLMVIILSKAFTKMRAEFLPLAAGRDVPQDEKHECEI